MRDRPCRSTPLVLDRTIAQPSPGSPVAARINTPSLEQVGPENVKGSLPGRCLPPGSGVPAGWRRGRFRTTGRAVPHASGSTRLLARSSAVRSRDRQGIHPGFNMAPLPPDRTGVDIHRLRECPGFHLPVYRRTAQARHLLDLPPVHQFVVTHMSQPLFLASSTTGWIKYLSVGSFLLSVCGHRLSVFPLRGVDKLANVEVPDKARGGRAAPISNPQLEPAAATVDGADVGLGDPFREVERLDQPRDAHHVVGGEQPDDMGLQRVGTVTAELAVRPPLARRRFPWTVPSAVGMWPQASSPTPSI